MQAERAALGILRYGLNHRAEDVGVDLPPITNRLPNYTARSSEAYANARFTLHSIRKVLARGDPDPA